MSRDGMVGNIPYKFCLDNIPYYYLVYTVHCIQGEACTVHIVVVDIGE